MSIEPGDVSLDDARRAFQEGRLQDTVQICQRLTSTDRTNYDAWQIMGAASGQAGLKSEAVEAFTQCVRLRPNLAQPHFNLALAYIAAGDTDNARSELETCLAVDPTYARASQQLQQLNPQPLESSIGGTGFTTAPGYGPPPIPGVPAYGDAPGIGQAPTMVGGPPPFNPGNPASFTPGASGLAGGNMPAPPASFASSMPGGAVQQSPSSGTTTAWAISSLILSFMYGGFVLLMISIFMAANSNPGMIQARMNAANMRASSGGGMANYNPGMPGQSPALPPGMAPPPTSMSPAMVEGVLTSMKIGAAALAIPAIIALGIFLGSIGVLVRKDIGRLILQISAWAAVVIVAIPTGIVIFSAIMHPATIAGAVMALVIFGIQIAYCLPLALHMGSDVAQTGMRG